MSVATDFGTWNISSLCLITKVNLIRKGLVDEAVVGYILGVFLPIVSYRIGQHVALFTFLRRAKQKIKRDERRTGGYGLRLREYDVEGDMNPSLEIDGCSSQEQDNNHEHPSVRAAVTALFLLLIVAQITAVFVFSSRSQQQFAISLLFSPLGVLARRQLLFLNHNHTPRSLWRYICGRCFPACFIVDDVEDSAANFEDSRFKGIFPVGTFLCNLLGCTLSGSIGSLLAGNPGEEESIVLESIILGFAGSLSTLVFLVEALSGIDPLISDYRSFTYLLSTLVWGLIVGFISSSI